MDYTALLNAVTGPQQGGLNAQQIQDNYQAFQDLQRQGITVSSLVQDLNDLKAKVEAMESKPRQQDAELFAVMEASVRDDPSVVSAYRHAQEVKAQIISEYCRSDPRYAQALDQYSREVHSAYIRRTESRALDTDMSGQLTD